MLSDVGSFDDTFKSTGDREWGNRAYKKGYRTVYGENVIVKHPARSTLSSFIKKLLRTVGGNYHFARKNNVYSSIRSSCLYLLGLLFPIKQTLSFFRNKDVRKVKGTCVKLKVVMLFVLRGQLKVYERFRMLFGGEPRNI